MEVHLEKKGSCVSMLQAKSDTVFGSNIIPKFLLCILRYSMEKLGNEVIQLYNVALLLWKPDVTNQRGVIKKEREGDD